VRGQVLLIRKHARRDRGDGVDHRGQGKRPPHLQIAVALREAITLGRLAPGGQLPSESELATLGR
jgi:DNA-binding GntR family transcriptional regulator